VILPIVATLLATTQVNPDVEMWGPMDTESLTVLMGQMGAALATKHDVTLRISSPGGETFATLLTIDKIEDMKARQHSRVHCVGSVMVASAAAILLESPVCDDRTITDDTLLLFHQVSGGTRGKAQDMEEEAHTARLIDAAIANMVAPRLGMTPKQYLAWIEGRDVIIGSDEALLIGAVDAVIPSGLTNRARVAVPARPVDGAVQVPEKLPPEVRHEHGGVPIKKVGPLGKLLKRVVDAIRHGLASSRAVPRAVAFLAGFLMGGSSLLLVPSLVHRWSRRGARRARRQPRRAVSRRGR